MSQPISVSVQMDAASFHDFAAFDLLRHREATFPVFYLL